MYYCIFLFCGRNVTEKINVSLLGGKKGDISGKAQRKSLEGGKNGRTFSIPFRKIRNSLNSFYCQISTFLDDNV